MRAELQKFLDLAESIPVGRKLRAVQEILARFPGKFLIFTEYRQTLDTLLRHLQQSGISAAGFHGGLSIEQKRLRSLRFVAMAMATMACVCVGEHGKWLKGAICNSVTS